MAIRSKNKPEETSGSSDEYEQVEFSNNPAINEKIDAHIAARPRDFAYYTDLVKTSPERAVRLLIRKDQQRYESSMKLVIKQLPGAREFYERQSPENRLRIDQKLQGVNPYFQDKAFVGEVLKEMDRQNRQTLAAPRTGVGVAAN